MEKATFKRPTHVCVTSGALFRQGGGQVLRSAHAVRRLQVLQGEKIVVNQGRPQSRSSSIKGVLEHAPGARVRRRLDEGGRSEGRPKRMVEEYVSF